MSRRHLAMGVWLSMLTACAAPRLAPVSAPSPSPAIATENSLWDWRALLVMPLGTRLRASPVALHEVLLFHAATASARARDCYTVDGSPPPWAGHPAEGYLLCFEDDRLHRIEASAPLLATAAAATLARVCAAWDAARAGAAGCQGRDGDIEFAATLSELAGDSTALLTVTLVGVSSPP